MSNKDSYYDHVDSMFSTLKGNPFTDGDKVAAVEQEATGQIQPSGWVQNASGTDGDAEVTIDADGITIVNGAITVSSDDGSTVIIDGTSEMFRVATSGSTDTGSVADGSSASTSVTHTGLVLTSTPALISFIGASIDGKSARSSGHFIGNNTGAMQRRYAAIASGGAVTTAFAAPVEYAFMTCTLNGSDEPFVTIYGINNSGSARTYYGKYYVMDLVAI